MYILYLKNIAFKSDIFPHSAQGTPLLLELERDNGKDVDNQDVHPPPLPEPSLDDSLELVLSPAPMEEDEEVEVKPIPDYVKLTYGSRTPVNIKLEHDFNYSITDDVIVLDDSGDEDDYNQSQHINVDDLLDDRESPVFGKDNDTSEGELSDVIDLDDDEHDDDEIQILNESQTPLFNAVLKKIKDEPVSAPQEEDLMEEFSQSLLDQESSSDGEDIAYIDDIVQAINGANEEMIREIYRRLNNSDNTRPTFEDVFPEVMGQVETNMVTNLSRHEQLKSYEYCSYAFFKQTSIILLV